MKVFRASFPGISLALVLLQMMLVSSIAGKYEYERWKCPRVWTRANGYDPDLAMRGRYLGLQILVDGCGSTLPSAAEAAFPRDVTGAVKPGAYKVGAQPVTFRASLSVENSILKATRIANDESGTRGLEVSAMPGAACNAMRLERPVDFYLSEHAQDPLPLKNGEELWIEVTVPPKGPPRPIQLARKQQEEWVPLGYQ